MPLFPFSVQTLFSVQNFLLHFSLKSTEYKLDTRRRFKNLGNIFWKVFHISNVNILSVRNGFLRRCWWQLSRVVSVICCVKAGRVTVSWLPLSSSHHRLTSQLLLNMKSRRFLPRVSMLLMRAAPKVTARQSWKREVELEAAGRLVGQLFRHTDHQIWFCSWHRHFFT